MADTQWYNDPLKLRDFAKALDDAGIVDSKDEVYEKPYKFDEYYLAWAENDFPDQSDSNWDEFVEAITPEDDGTPTQNSMQLYRKKP